MEWLLNVRVGIVPLASNSVNDAILKGTVSKTDDIGFELEPDKNSKLPISLTWDAVRSYKFVALSEKDA